MGEIQNLIENVSIEAQYDKNAKALLVQKPFLANILIRTVEEFQGADPGEVERLIEGEPRVSEVQVEPGFTNKNAPDGAHEIMGRNTENSIRREGVRYFDVLFDVRTKDGLAKVIVNMEAQKAKPSGYDLEMRGIFYAARLISSQLEREFTGKNYNGIQKVYSIWICMNCQENTFNRIHLANEDILGQSRWKDMYDVMNVGIICLAKTLDLDRSHELHRLLGAMFLPTVSIQDKEEIIEKEFRIELEGERKELIGTMCNLGEGIKEEALNEGEYRKLMELIIKKIKKNKSLLQIADELEETEETILPLYKAVIDAAPEYDMDKICEKIYPKRNPVKP